MLGQSYINTTGALHHIIARGMERRKIVEDEQDRYDFLKNLGLILEQTKTACFAWSLMTNIYYYILIVNFVIIINALLRHWHRILKPIMKFIRWVLSIGIPKSERERVKEEAFRDFEAKYGNEWAAISERLFALDDESRKKT